MNIEVSIRNYQAISSANFTFSPGLTVLTGDNNSGKSSTFRAIACAYFNQSTDGIKVGKPHAGCSIKHGDNKIVWRRSKSPASGASKTTYWINGTESSKVGRNQFDEVADLLHVKEIPILGRKIRLNFWDQESLPFLMQDTPSKVYEFLSLSSEEGNLTDVLRDIKSEINSISLDVKTQEGAIDAYTSIIQKEQNFLDKYKDFTQLFKDILSLESSAKEIEKLRNNLVTIDRNVHTIRSSRSALKPITQLLDDTQPKLQELDSLYPELVTFRSHYQKLLSSRTTVKTSKQSLSDLDEQLSLLDTSKIESLLNTIKLLDSELLLLTDAHKHLTRIRQKVSFSKEAIISYDKSLLMLNEELKSFKECPLCGNEIGDTHGH